VKTDALFARYYFDVAGFTNGTERFHATCRSFIPSGSRILEIGAGPANNTTNTLAALGPVTGVDVSDEVLSNPALTRAEVYDGVRLPFSAESFDACVSNYVLEHITNVDTHMREVARVLRPGGAYVIRTPNQWHYVTLASRLLPHRMHLAFANSLRGLKDEAHDPWPTVYRANSSRKLRKLASDAGLDVLKLELVEAEPSYGRSSALLFYPMMLYERTVNRFTGLSQLRASIAAVIRKPELSAER
jgi:ubiquinone/menaquinone biosynthesis C-methylase UbiE